MIARVSYPSGRNGICGPRAVVSGPASNRWPATTTLKHMACSRTVILLAWSAWHPRNEGARTNGGAMIGLGVAKLFVSFHVASWDRADYRRSGTLEWECR